MCCDNIVGVAQVQGIFQSEHVHIKKSKYGKPYFKFKRKIDRLPIQYQQAKD